MSVVVHTYPERYALAFSALRPEEGWYLSEMMGPFAEREDAKQLAELWTAGGEALYAHFQTMEGIGYWKNENGPVVIPDFRLPPTVKEIKLKKRVG